MEVKTQALGRDAARTYEPAIFQNNQAKQGLPVALMEPNAGAKQLPARFAVQGSLAPAPVQSRLDQWVRSLLLQLANAMRRRRQNFADQY